MRTSSEIERILTADGVLVRRQHPKLVGSLDRLLRCGNLRAVLPGVYAGVEQASDPLTRMLAVRARYPDAVLVGHGAAQLSYWPEAPLSTVEAALPTRVAPARGFRFTRSPIPAELIVERDDWRYTCPALTALDLAASTSGDSIDLALRSRETTLADLHEALRLTPGRAGNMNRRRALLDSRDGAWSAAERRAHRLLREAGVTGWVANLPVIAAERLYYLDIAFKDRKLVIEIDGRLHETDEDLFQTDRWRQNALMLDGWQVLRFTWEMLCDHPEVVVATILAALAR